MKTSYNGGKEQGGRSQPVSTPSKSPSVRKPASVGSAGRISPNSSNRGKDQ